MLLPQEIGRRSHSASLIRAAGLTILLHRIGSPYTVCASLLRVLSKSARNPTRFAQNSLDFSLNSHPDAAAGLEGSFLDADFPREGSNFCRRPASPRDKPRLNELVAPFLGPIEKSRKIFNNRVGFSRDLSSYIPAGHVLSICWGTQLARMMSGRSEYGGRLD
jgi:hypothetical protein